MANYRKLVKRFWSDSKIRDLTDKQKLLFIYAITGIEACSFTTSGIYEIHRSAFENYLRWSHDEVNETLDYFNRKKSILLEYDVKEHIIYVKSFFKYNGTYKKSLDGLISDFNDTFSKAPLFWADFGERYREELGKNYSKFEKEEKDFLDKLFILKDKDLPNKKITLLAASKVSDEESQFFDKNEEFIPR